MDNAVKLTLAFLFICTSAFGAIYINPNSATDGVGTIGDPWNTWEGKTLNTYGQSYLQIAGSDTTLVATYKSIASDNITIGSYGTGARPIIRRSRAEATSTREPVFYSNNNSTTFTGIEIIATNYVGIEIAASYKDTYGHNINNCLIIADHTAGEGRNAGIWLNTFSTTRSLHDITIDGNYITSTSGTLNGGIVSYNNRSQAYDWDITDNTIYNINGNGIALYGDTSYKDLTMYGLNIARNTITNISSYCIGVETGTRVVDGHLNYVGYNSCIDIGDPSISLINAYQINGFHNTIIEHNICDGVDTSGSGDGNCFIDDFAYTDNNYLSDGNIYRYNIAKNAKADGFQVWKGKNTVLYNNIAAGNSSGFSHFNDECTGVSFLNNTAYGNVNGLDIDGYAGSSETTWINNISAENSGKGFRCSSCSTPVENNNLIFGTSDVTLDATDKTTDPQFVDASIYNFNLKVTSPAINAGTYLPEVTDDYNGNPRIGNDIGAIAYGRTNYNGLTISGTTTVK